MRRLLAFVLIALLPGFAPAAIQFQAISAQSVGLALWPLTAGEKAAGLTWANITPNYQPGDVRRYGAVGDCTTDDTTAFTRAAAYVSVAGGTIYLGPQCYLITGLSIRANNVSIVGQGSAVSILKQNPSGFGTGGVIELGNTALGNSAPNYDKLTVSGLTIDGNRSSIAAPADDLHGHGLALTNITHFSIHDVEAKNTWNAGIGIFINSDYGTVDAVVENSGNSNAGLTPVAFDINSSRYIALNVVVNNAPQTGFRALDNCYGITGSVTVNNAAVDGAVINDQTVNNSYAENLSIAVNGGASSAGIIIGNNVHNSTFNIAVNGVTGIGVQESYFASNMATGNVYNVSTNKGQVQGVEIGGEGGTWNIASFQDGRAGAAGSTWAIQVDGSYNSIVATVIDSATPQVRGVLETANSAHNTIASYTRNATVQDWSDLGTGNLFKPQILTGNASVAFGTVATGVTSEGNVTVTGASGTLHDTAVCETGVNNGGVGFFSEVTAANTVSIWAINDTGAGQALGTRSIYCTVTRGTP